MNFETFSKSVSEMSGEEFLADSPSICHTLQSEHGILMFAFVICNEETPYLRKTMRDSVYFDALNAASGDRLVVFTVADDIKEDNKKYLLKVPGVDGALGDSTSAILSVFGLRTEVKYPSILFFQPISASIEQVLIVELGKESTEKSVNQMQAVFKSVRGVLDKITVENFPNKVEIFNQVEQHVYNQELRSKILAVGTNFLQVAALIRKLMGW